MRLSLIWLAVTLAILSTLGVSLAAPLAQAPNTPTPLPPTIYNAPWQFTPPVIDGDLGDWQQSQRIVLDRDTASFPPPPTGPAPQDLSGWTSILWDSDYLYVALSTSSMTP